MSGGMGSIGASLNPFAAITAATLGPVTDYFQTQAQNQQNEHMFNKAVQVERENWNMQNQYNRPDEMMKRLEDAGINPQMVAGQFANSRASDIGTPAPPHMGKMSPVDLASYQQVLNAQAGNKLTRSQTEKIAQETRKAKADADITEHVRDVYKKTGTIPGDAPWIRSGGRVFDFLQEFGEKRREENMKRPIHLEGGDK